MESRKRKRGLKASREKLEKALKGASFKTQHALAQAIADTEALSKPPKDLVSKVFNEKAVSEKNFNRVAKGLGVEVHEILLSNEHIDEASDTRVLTNINEVTPQSSMKTNQYTKNDVQIHDNHTDKQDTKSAKLSNSARRYIVTSLTVVIAIFVIWFNTHSATDVTNTKIDTSLGKVLVVLQSPPELNSIARALITQSEAYQEMNIIMPESPDAYTLDAETAIKQWNAHAVLTLSVERAEFYLGVKAEMSSLSHHRLLSTLFARSTELNASANSIGDTLIKQVQRFVKGEALDVVYGNTKEAFSAYLQALDLLFLSHTSDNFVEVEHYLTRALSIEAEFVHALALMCATKVRQSWMFDSIVVLEKAGEYCNAAEKVAPEHHSTRAARILFLSKAGSLLEAIRQAEEMHHNTSNEAVENADFYALLAELLALASIENSELTDSEEKRSDLKEKLIGYADKAFALEKRHWRAFNELGNYYFRQGDIKSANLNYRLGSEVVKHEIMLSNLGTTQLCFAQFEQAIDTYKSLLTVNKNSYLAYEQLGSAYFFLHDFDKALANKLTAILEQPEISIHQLWGSVGEIYRLLGNDAKAYDYFNEALQHVERDLLLEAVNDSDKLHALYYQAKLQGLVSTDYSVNELNGRVTTFLDNPQNLGLKAKSHLAWLSGVIGKQEKRQQIIAEISSICPAYQYSPELL